jgi:fatty-acyl-CoA synthase
VRERFAQVTGRPLHEVYGMTEASGLIALHASGDAGGEGSVGWPLPYSEVLVRRALGDGRLGALCKPHEVGVITVRGPQVSPGYRDPAHNQGVLHDGELNTGDLGYTDEQGRLYMAGRAKDLIIRSGHNIDPQMIENAMSTHPAVALAAAVGMPDAYAGELPVCYVMLRPGAAAADEHKAVLTDLHAHAQRLIGERPAWPKHIFIIDAMPLTSVGKIFKPKLRCDAAERLVQQVLSEQHGLTTAHVLAREGGRRGLLVQVSLPAAARLSVPLVEQALARYLFEAEVRVQAADA